MRCVVILLGSGRKSCGDFSTTVCFLSFNPELRYTSTIELNGGIMSSVELTGDW